MTYEDAYDLASKVPGWFSEYDFGKLYELLQENPPGVVLEVGSFLGRSAVFISCFRPVVCIDPWKLGPWFRRKISGLRPEVDLSGEDFSFLFQEYAIQNNPFGHRITPIKAKDDAVWDEWSHGPIGLLHLDHEHTDEAVYKSLHGWQKHLLPDAKMYLHDSHLEAVAKGIRRSGVRVLHTVRESKALPVVCVWPKLHI